MDNKNKDKMYLLFVPEIDKKQKEIITSNVKKVLECEEKSFKLIKETLDYFNDILKIDVKRLNQDKVFYIDQEQITDTFCPYFYYPLFTEYIQTLKKKFKTIKLSQIIDIKSGDEVGSENYSVSLKKNLNDIPFIRTSDIINYEVDSYPDYYVVPEIQSQLSQDIKDGDVLFTKDGKIGLSGMITSNDDCILASGIAYMRLKQPQKICPEYVFICLSSNIGLFQAMQRTVTSSTLPHLRPEHILEFEIPLIDEEYQQEITKKVKQAFKLKDEKKTLIRETKKILEDNIDKKIKVEFNNFE